MSELVNKWMNLDSAMKVVIAALFFSAVGASSERLLGQTRTLHPRLEEVEAWRKSHTADYQENLEDIRRLTTGQDYIICVLSAQRTQRTEQDCYEVHILSAGE